MFSATAILGLLIGNVAMLARTAQDSRTNQGGAFVYNTFIGGQRPAFVGLDLTIINNDNATRNIVVDGQSYPINAGVSRAILNAPYITIANDPAASSVTFFIQGIYVKDIVALKAMQGGGKLTDGVLVWA